jgi:REP element-mobilizing transposase RayT
MHLLVNEPERATLAQAMQSLKQGVARRLALRAADSFREARYYDFNLWSERKSTETVSGAGHGHALNLRDNHRLVS